MAREDLVYMEKNGFEDPNAALMHAVQELTKLSDLEATNRQLKAELEGAREIRVTEVQDFEGQIELLKEENEALRRMKATSDKVIAEQAALITELQKK